MRRCHRRPAKNRVSIIRGIITGTSACARCSDIWFDPITPVDCDRAAAAEGSNVIRPGLQSANRVRRGINSGRVHYGGTVGTVVTRTRHHHDPGSSLSFHSSLQCVRGTAFGRWADPGVTRDIRSPERIALAAAYWVRCKKPFHALDVSGRRAVASIHVTATDPFRSRRHTDLVARAVV